MPLFRIPKPSSSCTSSVWSTDAKISPSLVRQDHIVPIQNILLSQYPVLPRAFHLLQPWFIDNCEHWKNQNGTGMLQDVYDGRIWQQFMQVLTTSTRLALMLMWIGFSMCTHVLLV